MNDRTIFCCCLLLVCNGIIVGVNIDCNGDTLDCVFKVFSIVTITATVLTAIFGLKGFRTGRYQFHSSTKTKAFRELEAVAFSCIDAIENYITVYDDEFFHSKAAAVYADHDAARSDVLVKICHEKEKFRIDADFAQSLLTKKELAVFSYSYTEFDAEIHRILRDISHSYQTEGEGRCQKLCQVESDISKLKSGIKGSFRGYWEI